MKHRLTYVWLGLYTVLSLGVQVNLHYCSDQLKTIGLWVEVACCHHEESDGDHEHNHCSEHDEDCCSDETIDLGLEDVHLTSRQANRIVDFDALLSVIECQISLQNSEATSLLEAPKTGPPILIDGSDRYAQFQQRITYG